MAETPLCAAKAPAKVILVGEHWVVHGGRALASSVGLYAKARCRRRSGAALVRALDLGLEEDFAQGCDRLCNLMAAYRYLREAIGEAGFECSIESEIPPGAGLGSSAAVAVAFSAAYMCLLRGGVDYGLVNRAAFEAEKVAHGNPSGIDNTVSTYGGLVLYRRGEAPRIVSLPRGRLRLLVVDTRVSRSTRIAVERFRGELAALQPGLRAALMQLNDLLVGYAVDAVSRGDAATLGRVMNVAHGLLQAMGVSSGILDTVVNELRARGAYGAKLSGAGIGGVVVAATPPEKKNEIARSLSERGLRVYEVSLPSGGVSLLRR